MSNILTKKELIALEREWCLKLKQSGFHDIERWDKYPHSKKHVQIKFIKGHIRWDDYKTPEEFLRISQENSEYFRVIEVFANHSDSVKPKYKKVLQIYAQTANLASSVSQAYPNSPNIRNIITSAWMYIQAHFSKMLEFTNNYDRETFDYDR